ncbi:MAG: hypothetical protein NC338_00800 [Firmicutes bacterium]|nr:hypothetical protein [Bacillota bacterium]MCM1400463.1 hypothetical protein [Bacteroides sp.]MCM1477434.1 hypothetical protein [Bacteroides sp.]
MNKINKILLTATVAAASVTLPACSDNDDSHTYLYGPFEEFANIESNSESAVNFLVYDEEDKTTLTLECYQTELVDPQVYPTGSRVLITYNITSAITSPNPMVEAIHLTNITKAYMAPIETALPSDFTPENVQFTLVGTEPYKTGNYINMKVSLPAARERSFICVMKSEEGGVPSLQLLTSVIREADADYAGKREIYPVSIDISNVWDQTNSNTLDLIMNTTNFGNDSKFNFMR